MNHRELNWKSQDGLDLFGQAWEPAVVSPRAVICLVHGLGEHISRYAHVAEALGKEGFILIGNDLRGHGRSAGARGHINSVEEYLQDIDELINQAKTRYPNLPVILYGHSLGGILSLHYCLKRKPELKGVIVTSPALRSSLEEQTLKVMAVKILGAISPGTLLDTGLDANDISRDAAVVKSYVSDPLVHSKASFGFGRIMLDVTKWNLEHAGEFQLPLLLMHGKADKIAYATSSTEFASAMKERATLILWDGAYHELHNELEKAEVFKTMVMWLDARLREG